MLNRYTLAAALTISLAAGPLLADTVELVSGDVLHGTVTAQTDDAVTLSHPVLGDLVLPAKQVKSVTLDAKKADAEAAPKAAPEAVKPEPEAKPINAWADQLLPGWDKHFELGFTGTDGNSQTDNLNIGFDAKRENDEQRTHIDLSYFRTDDDGNRTRNDATAEATHDWLMPGSPWFKFVNGKLEYDEFSDWQTRAGGFLGVGKQIVKNDKHNLIGRVGAGASYEFDSINDLVPELLLGLEWTYTINDRQALSTYLTVYPDLDEFGQSRTLVGAAWTIKVDQADGLSLKLGIDDEYQSKTESDAKHNDVKYYGALVFDF